jgi:energy-coupling factor transport system permease protein
MCFLTSVFMFWDLRVLAVFFVFVILTIITAGLSWKETWRTWLLLGAFTSFYALLTLLTGRIGMAPFPNERVLMTLRAPFSVFGIQPQVSVSIEQLFYALSQFARILCIASMTLMIPRAIDPAQYGITFRRLGLPDKLAFALDLTMRFVPSLGRDFTMTMNAQKARGYELESRAGGLIGMVRRLTPLLVPVIIHSIISGEEITDAMDLRAFGVRPRTWLRTLRYQWYDYVLTTFSVVLIAASITVNLLGYGHLWTP